MSNLKEYLLKLPPELQYLIDPVLKYGRSTEEESFEAIVSANNDKSLHDACDMLFENTKGKHFDLALKYVEETMEQDCESSARLNSFLFAILPKHAK